MLQNWINVCSTDGHQVTQLLTSHSFRRGAAQSANSDSILSTPWILDRGGWSLNSVSKAFSYIFSTTHEDQKVAKSLAAVKHNTQAILSSLASFDVLVSRRIKQLGDELFLAAGIAHDYRYNDAVLEVFLATAILNVEKMRELNAESLYVKQICHVMSKLCRSECEFSAWTQYVLHRVSEND